MSILNPPSAIVAPRRWALSVVSAAILLAAVALPAQAATVYTFNGTGTTVSSAGSKDQAGNAVSGTAIFTIDGNSLSIKLENTTQHMKDPGQLITALTFNLTGPTGLTLTNKTGTVEQLDGGVFSPWSPPANGKVNENGWGLSDDTGETYTLGFQGTGGAKGSAYTIISSHLDSSVGGLDGNPAHNPFYVDAATFSFNMTGLLAGQTVGISNVNIIFGTAYETTIPTTPTAPGIAAPTPAAASLAFVGGAMLLVGGWIRKRRAG